MRAVVQAKPVNYDGAFRAAGDPTLERAWAIGAWTVRATLQGQYMNNLNSNAKGIQSRLLNEVEFLQGNPQALKRLD